MIRTRGLAGAIAAAAALGCGDSTSAPGPLEPPLTPPPLAQLIVSNPVPHNGATLAYVSIAPGGVSNGSGATLANRRTGSRSTQWLASGGLDPTAIVALAGDTIEVAIDTGGTLPLTFVSVVPAAMPLAVVRTDPANGKANTALDARVMVIFSEPVDSSSLTGETAALAAAGVPVSGSLALSPDGLSLAFSPSAELLPGTDYTFALGSGILASDGLGLASAVSFRFRTDTYAPPQPGSREFPPIPSGARAYARVIEPGEPSGSLSRYLLFEDGRFILQYVTQRFGFFQYGGRYTGTTALALTFDANGGRWTATATLQGDSLTVGYNLDMQMSDFVDGVYRLVPSTNVLAFSKDGDLYVINADGTGLRQVTSGVGRDFEPAWSPDGTRIAFTRYRPDLGSPRWGEAAIYLVNVDGTGLLRLSGRSDSTFDAHPSWSPDGTRIAFYSRREHDADPFHANDSDIYVMQADGTGAVRLTRHGANVFHPAWSPDGSRIAFWAWNWDAQAFAIYLMQADGSGLSPIVSGESAFAPAWSPDGSRILTRTVRCLAWGDVDPVTMDGPNCLNWEGPHLTTVRPDGSDPARLSEYVIRGNDEQATGSSWSPDGQLVAFTQIGCSWPEAEWSCQFPSSIEVLRLSDGQVTRLTGGSTPSWRR
ncbi:MAG TPA: Ig-like domain-containing protein [Gemmatimonadales bacterium]|nr:Ig-like domain-containing protein [Gemmatimonadales bacterium]